MLSGSTVWKDVGNYCDPYFDLSDIFNRGILDMAEKWSGMNLVNAKNEIEPRGGKIWSKIVLELDWIQLEQNSILIENSSKVKLSL